MIQNFQVATCQSRSTLVAYVMYFVFLIPLSITFKARQNRGCHPQEILNQVFEENFC